MGEAVAAAAAVTAGAVSALGRPLSGSYLLLCCETGDGACRLLLSSSSSPSGDVTEPLLRGGGFTCCAGVQLPLHPPRWPSISSNALSPFLLLASARAPRDVIRYSGGHTRKRRAGGRAAPCSLLLETRI